ncbi:LLM class flavin-dependent oxidoreductase [Pseudonocardia sp. GCM10023141]|uniref:LLM class flavin-dependent oxidoreductase n=1 Tax=Pseudonocardia sp. GCM10023141 TaxID=3252653 RepID=UPI00361A7E3B
MTGGVERNARPSPAELQHRRRQRRHGCWDHLIVAPLWVAYQANLGTLLRTCDAAGACLAVPRTPHYRDALRRGNTLTTRSCVRWVAPSKLRWVREQRRSGSRIVAVELADGAIALSRLAPATQRTVVLLGHEHHGIPAEVWDGRPGRQPQRRRGRIARALPAGRPRLTVTGGDSGGSEVLGKDPRMTAPPVRYGVYLPPFGPFGDPTVLVDLAVRAEAAGWDGVFLWDHVVTTAMPIVDTWTTLGAIAQATTRILIGPMVTPPARRRPWVLARQASTVNRLSGGRLVFGTGLGTDESGDFSRVGEPADVRTRAATFTEGLGLIREMWSGRRIRHNGPHFRVTLDESPPEPHPIPVWMASSTGNPRVTRRAVQADGIFPNPPDHTDPRRGGHHPRRRTRRRAARRPPLRRGGARQRQPRVGRTGHRRPRGSRRSRHDVVAGVADAPRPAGAVAAGGGRRATQTRGAGPRGVAEPPVHPPLMIETCGCGRLGAVEEIVAATPVADRFARLCASVVGGLPWGLARIVAPSLLGFAVINGCTFALDLGLLAVLRSLLGLDVAAAFGTAYLIAFAVSFVLNRRFNFRSHAPVGRQTAIYAVVVAVNFFGLILGLATGLTALGMHYLAARIVAGCCEAVFMYCAMRWVVFRN